MAKVFYYMLRIWLMVFGNYDTRKKLLKNVSVIISEYPENISIMMILTVFNKLSWPRWLYLNNSEFIDTHVNSPNNNLNKILDNAQSEIKDLTEKSKSDLLGLIKLRKENPNDLNIAYLNINNLREKIISLREIYIKSSIDVLCVNETKLDASYPNAQFHIEGYQFPPCRRDRNKHGGGKMYLYETV